MSYCQQHGRPVINQGGGQPRSECDICQVEVGPGIGEANPPGTLMGRMWFTVSKDLLRASGEDDAVLQQVADSVRDQALQLLKNPPRNLLQEPIT